MVVIVLTGGIGAGKSTAAAFFAARGAAVIDADEVAAGVLAAGSPVLGAVAAEFGEGVLGPDGSLDRAALADACFSEPGAAARLNALVHPAVGERIAQTIARLKDDPVAPSAVVVEVPLLAEAPELASMADVVVAICASEDIRVERGTARGSRRSDVERRSRAQAPDAARAALADVVLLNEGTNEQFTEALERFWAGLVGGDVSDG